MTSTRGTVLEMGELAHSARLRPACPKRTVTWLADTTEYTQRLRPFSPFAPFYRTPKAKAAFTPSPWTRWVAKIKPVGRGAGVTISSSQGGLEPGP